MNTVMPTRNKKIKDLLKRYELRLWKDKNNEYSSKNFHRTTLWDLQREAKSCNVSDIIQPFDFNGFFECSEKYNEAVNRTIDIIENANNRMAKAFRFNASDMQVIKYTIAIIGNCENHSYFDEYGKQFYNDGLADMHKKEEVLHIVNQISLAVSMGVCAIDNISESTLESKEKAEKVNTAIEELDNKIRMICNHHKLPYETRHNNKISQEFAYFTSSCDGKPDWNEYNFIGAFGHYMGIDETDRDRNIKKVIEYANKMKNIAYMKDRKTSETRINSLIESLQTTVQ